jgi:hypothetical protein
VSAETVNAGIWGRLGDTKNVYTFRARKVYIHDMPKNTVIILRVTAAEKAFYQEAAGWLRMSLSEWLRMAADNRYDADFKRYSGLRPVKATRRRKKKTLEAR